LRTLLREHPTRRALGHYHRGTVCDAKGLAYGDNVSKIYRRIERRIGRTEARRARTREREIRERVQAEAAARKIWHRR
jgi:hypothetical protein